MKNCWCIVSDTLVTEYQTYQADPENYTGTLTADAIKALNAAPDCTTVSGLFKPVTKNGKTYHLFSIYGTDEGITPAIINQYLTDLGDNIEIIGVWDMGGVQMGQSYDADGNLTGTPDFPIPADAYLCMPDQITYDAEGNEIVRDVAVDNSYLRDINLMAGQAPRNFN